MKRGRYKKRKGTSVLQFVKRIPADVRQAAIGKTITIPLGFETAKITITEKTEAIRFSLRTARPAQAEARTREALTRLEQFWEALRRTSPIRLTYRQVTALAGDLYKHWTEVEEREHINPDVAASRLRKLISLGPHDSVEPTLGPAIDSLLLSHGIASVDEETRLMLLKAAHMALQDALAALERNAAGDYAPDAKAQRFPKWQPIAATEPSPPSDHLTLTSLLEGWWREAKGAGRKPSTYESYRTAVASLVGFLEHDDAARVTSSDVVRFKEYLLTSPRLKTGKPASAKTIKHSYLVGLKAVFGWGVANQRLPANPASGVTITLGKKPKLRSKGFTEAEATAILQAALTFKPLRKPTRTDAAIRWVPWLCALTGARVGELAQLRKQDLHRVDSLWIIRITPEAGTVKTNEARDVVLHPQIVEQGFPAFVRGSANGHLFLRPNPETGDVLGPLQGLKNRLAEFARTIVTDPNVAPNHGWRHRFKTVGMEAGIAPRILDAIQGHAASSVADSYGHVTVKTMAEAIERLPWIKVD